MPQMTTEGAVLLLRTQWLCQIAAFVAIFLVAVALAWVLVTSGSRLLESLAKYYEAKTADLWRGDKK